MIFKHCDAVFNMSPTELNYLIFDDINEVHNTRPLFRITQVEHILLVASVGCVVGLDFQGKPVLKDF